ncbi:MAG: heavy-metal-associated domain-containing protein [Rhodospirillales bacterium]|nr:heavy-metal-associated domain-containing protein [Rhodospirillales bacterium]
MIELKVSGMTCQHCVHAVTAAVGALPGVRGVAVDLAAGTVRVEGSPDPAALRAAIEEEGYSLG